VILSLFAAGTTMAYLAHWWTFDDAVVWLLFFAVLHLAKIAEGQQAALTRAREMVQRRQEPPDRA